MKIACLFPLSLTLVLLMADDANAFGRRTTVVQAPGANVLVQRGLFGRTRVNVQAAPVIVERQVYAPPQQVLVERQVQRVIVERQVQSQSQYYQAPQMQLVPQPQFAPGGYCR